MSTAIRTNDLTKVYQDKLALDRVNFEIPYGKVTALLGANGAGKSTTLQLITGLLDPTQGEVYINGKNLLKEKRDVIQSIGFLTSEFSLYEKLSVYENLRFSAELRGLKNHDFEKNLERVNKKLLIKEFIHQRFSDLSSGQKQRSLIAAATIHDPQILIFDEVTASLDISSAKKVMDFLLEEKERGKAILFSTHILSEVEYIADNVVLIDKGKLITSTPFSEFLKDYKGENLSQSFYQFLEEINHES